jgi:DMSO/TMAO reductase YedYZ molybdopterin-dependent catalytic subunit
MPPREANTPSPYHIGVRCDFQGLARSRSCGGQGGALQVRFNGLDTGVVPQTPDFMKSLDIDHARDGEVMIVYAMNGAL